MKHKRDSIGRYRAAFSKSIYTVNRLDPEKIRPGYLVWDKDTEEWKYKDKSGNIKIITGGASGSGDVEGPSSSTADNIAVFADTSGKKLKDGSLKVTDIQFSMSTNIDFSASPFTHLHNKGRMVTGAVWVDPSGWLQPLMVKNNSLNEVEVSDTGTGNVETVILMF